MPVPAALIAAAAPAAIQSISGLFGVGKGNLAAKKNLFPEEQVNPIYAENLAIAENAARVGMPQQQYNRAQQGFQRNRASALRQLSRMGRPVNSAAIVRAGNDSQLDLDVADANIRQGNQRFAMGQRAQLANEQNRVFDWNKRQRYLQRAEANAQQIGAGKQNFMGGLNNLSLLGQYAMFGGESGGSQPQGNIFNTQGFTDKYINGWSKPNYNPTY